MPTFSSKSQTKLMTCDKKLRAICEELIKEIDFIVLCGNRDKVQQDEALKNGTSKLKFPLSKHNKFPSLAVDIAPYPINWNDIERFKDLAARFKRIAEEKGVTINWGGDWRMRDYPHFELV